LLDRRHEKEAKKVGSICHKRLAPRDGKMNRIVVTNESLLLSSAGNPFAGLRSRSSILQSIRQKSVMRGIDLSGEIFDFLLVRLRP